MSNNITDRPELPKVDTQSTLSALDLRSGAGWLASADAAVRDRFLSEIGEGGLCALPFLFEFWALPHQVPPEGDWRSWVIMGGRGAGKTRAGAEWVRHVVEGPKPLDKGVASRVALLGETFDQVRDVMIFGVSGILQCSPPDHLTWIRRTRLDGDDWAGLEVPLAEESESYIVQVWANGAQVREQIVTEPIWLYTAAMKTTDGVSGTYDVQVAQVSASYGPGLFAHLTVR
ncbi:hypothetical protein RUM8411_00318 [Ruegeria meonggei]|uniref:Terminase-like family protein n=1 Tax=Ruegeria meonggei TaxID=1446476 RepID=A0A1X6Y8B9_9RHOB|nr:hypothetical protein RUM8411_00318 [Ruegeria meonggei]